MLVEELAGHVARHGGVATSSELKAAGFSAGLIAHAREVGLVERVTRGVYCTPDVFDDDFLIIGARWRKCIFSHGSALYLNGLSDRLPAVQSVSVPRGYHPARLGVEFPGIQIHWVRGECYELGVSSVTTPAGNSVRCYSAERSIADLLKQRRFGGIDPQLVRDAIGGYFKREDKDLHALSRMCQTLGVGPELQVYLEVL